MHIQSFVIKLDNSSLWNVNAELSKIFIVLAIQSYEIIQIDNNVTCLYEARQDLRETLLQILVTKLEIDSQRIKTFYGKKPVLRNLIKKLMYARAKNRDYFSDWNGKLSEPSVLLLKNLWQEIEEKQLDYHIDRAVISRLIHEVTSPLYKAVY